MSFVLLSRLLVAVLTLAMSGFAQAGTAPPSGSQNPGSAIVFPKFHKGTVTPVGTNQPETEIKIAIACPKDQTCTENQQVKIRFHWVCPGGQDFAGKFICREESFDLTGTVNGTVLFDSGGAPIAGHKRRSIPQAPCPMGYLIGWVIDPTSDQPVKFDGLLGSAVIRELGSAALEYSALPVRADPELQSFPASGSAIATGTDRLTGHPTLVFDGGPGHYASLGGQAAARPPSPEPSGDPSSRDRLLTLLTLDVRPNRPNYPTFVKLNVSIGNTVSWVSRDFVCWTEVSLFADQQYKTAASATAADTLLSGRAVKAPFLGISDEPGPVILLGLVQTREPRAAGIGNRADVRVIERTDGVTPRAIFAPF